MTEDRLLFIESRLKITLPKCYRTLHHAHADRLTHLKWTDDAINPLYLTAEHVIAPNIEERRPEMGTACAFPKWWKSFFLIGTNGGGDYYSLRLDNTAGVWLIGSDCNATPTRVADSLQQYVEQTIAEYEARKALKAERVRRRAPFQKEIDAHLSGLRLASDWMTCDAIYPMFQALQKLDPKISPRKLRLYGLALCRLIPGVDNDTDCAAGIALAKILTLREVPQSRISKMRSRLRRKINALMGNPETSASDLWRTNAVYFLFQDDAEYLSDAAVYPNDPYLAEVYSAAGYAIAGYPYGVEQAPDLLREVLGNPFHAKPISPRWRTPKVLSLARAIFKSERFDRMPDLATSLAAAGCTDERVLAHCQRPNDHVCGCWVVDSILGK